MAKAHCCSAQARFFSLNNLEQAWRFASALKPRIYKPCDSHPQRVYFLENKGFFMEDLDNRIT